MRAIDPKPRHLRIDRAITVLSCAVLVLCATPRAHAQAGADTLNLFWTAPGDDGLSGIASTYDVRYSTTPITALNFGLATALPSLPAPAAAGSAERMVVRGLSRSTDYWFALRTRDEAGNWSTLSNVLRWQWTIDRFPPTTPQNVFGEVTPTLKSVRLRWRAGTEPDLVGYHVYRAAAASGPYERRTAVPIATPEYLDEPLPPGEADLWYQVASVDAVANESPRTAAIRVIRTPTGSAVSSWKLRPAYPNPARLGETQRLPIELPRGAGVAVIDILDSAGQRVRRLQSPLAGPGFGELVWDGRNDMGALVVPGLYRAWLAADGQRQFTRLVRVP